MFSIAEKDNMLEILTKSDQMIEPDSDEHRLARILCDRGFIYFKPGYGAFMKISITDKGLSFLEQGGYTGEIRREEEVLKRQEREKRREYNIKIVGILTGGVVAIITILKYIFNRT